jgi:hypothetical protein
MGTGLNNLLVYQKSFELAMNIFRVTKSFPKEEMYSLTDQAVFQGSLFESGRRLFKKKIYCTFY